MTERQFFENMMTFLGMEIVSKPCLTDKGELVLYEERSDRRSSLTKIEISDYYNASAGAVFTESGDIWKAFYGSGPTRPGSNTEWLLNEMYEDAMRSQVVDLPQANSDVCGEEGMERARQRTLEENAELMRLLSDS